MEILVAIGHLVADPTSWAVGFFLFMMLMVYQGKLVPRSQVDELIAQHNIVTSNLESTIAMSREDRTKAEEKLIAEKDRWRDAAEESHDVAAEVRKQNGELIQRLSALDHLLDELRKITGLPKEVDRD